jgi:hypothetical protein
MSRCLSQSIELRALAMFFNSSTLIQNKDTKLSHGHFDFLQPLYQRVTSDSPLALATSWLAVLVMGFSDMSRPCHEAQCKLMSRAIQHTLGATKDPVKSVETETLAAVVLLGHGEYLQNSNNKHRARRTATLKIHQDGAEALIRRRGALNFQDSTSIALFNAVRHNSVSLAISGVKADRKNWDLWILDDKVSQLCDCYTPATELDACGFIMLSIQHSLASENCSAYVHLQTDLLRLSERLRSWSFHVPGEWTDYTTPIINQTPKEQSQGVCYLFNQWYLLRLAVSHLSKELDLRRNVPAICASDFSCELDCIDNLMASASVLLDSMSPIISVSLPRGEDPVFAIEEEDGKNRGSRYFDQTMEKLDLVISNALKNLILPPTITMCYQEVLSWSRKRSNLSE